MYTISSYVGSRLDRLDSLGVIGTLVSKKNAYIFGRSASHFKCKRLPAKETNLSLRIRTCNRMC